MSFFNTQVKAIVLGWQVTYQRQRSQDFGK